MDHATALRAIETDQSDLDNQIEDLETLIDRFNDNARDVLKKLKAERDHLYGVVSEALDGFEKAEDDLQDAQA